MVTISTLTFGIATRGPRSPVTIEVLQSRPGLAEGLVTPSTSAARNCSNGPSRQLFLFFPGNPGMVHFYRAFVDDVVAGAASSGTTLDAIVFGYVGHSFQDLNAGGVYALSDQENMALEVSRRVFSEVRRSYPEYTAVYVGGHSIGAHVATLVADDSRQEPLLRRVFLLAPTLCYMRDSPEGINKWPLLSSRWNILASVCSGVLKSLVPKEVLRRLIRAGDSKCVGEHAETVIQILRPSNLRNVLTMARSELEEVYELDTARLGRIRQLVVAWFPKDDHWCPLPFYRLIACALKVRHFSDDEIIAKKNSTLGSGEAAPPLCLIDTHNDFVHAWCLGYSYTVASKMVVPFLSAE